MIGLVISALGGLRFAYESRIAYQDSALDLAVRVRLQGAGVDVAQNLSTEWDRLAAISERSEVVDIIPAGLGTAFGAAKFIRWAGLIDVETGTYSNPDDALVSFAQQAWLTVARTTPYIGLVDGVADDGIALVMARPFGPEIDRKIIALVMPLTDLAKGLESTAQALEIDLFLVSPDHSYIIGTNGAPGELVDLASQRNAAVGVASSQRETWPDGRTYFSAVLPLDGLSNLPATGLRLIGRISPAEFAAADSVLVSGSIRLVLVLLGAIGLLTFLFIKNFVTPFGVLARNAERIANGYDDYPYEANQTRELATLSAAIARLNGR